MSIPFLHFRVVSQKNVLNFFFDLFWIFFKFCQIWNINQSFERILFNFLLNSASCNKLSSFFSFTFSLLSIWSCFLLSRILINVCHSCQGSFNHSIILKRTFISRSIFKRKDSKSMFQIFNPFTFVLWSIWVVKDSFSVS